MSIRCPSFVAPSKGDAHETSACQTCSHPAFGPTPMYISETPPVTVGQQYFEGARGVTEAEVTYAAALGATNSPSAAVPGLLNVRPWLYSGN